MAEESNKSGLGIMIGPIVILESTRFKPGTIIQIQRAEMATGDAEVDVSSLRDMLLRHAGAIRDSDLPSDLAENLDHYLFELDDASNFPR